MGKNKNNNKVKIKKAIVSVYDKNGLEEFIKNLVRIIPEIVIYSTGGTYANIEKYLIKGPINLKSISDYTGQPEMQGGLVKTLDFKIYLGLLSETYNEDHNKDLHRAGADTIDLVVTNLYPFDKVIAGTDVNIEKARGNIDIGGPCMLRAAAKNFIRVASICDPKDYRPLIEELEKSNGSISFNTRYKLAKKAFKHTADYDKTVSGYLDSISDDDAIKTYNLINN